MTRFALVAVICSTYISLVAQNSPSSRQIQLPTSKRLSAPSPGRIGALNSFPSTIALSPDRRYAAILNDGYGTQEALARQSISILDLQTNQLSDFPDDRLPEEARQSYFLGLAFSADGSHLYASMVSLTDPSGEKPDDTGNGIAVYSFQQGRISAERFIKIAPQKIAEGKKVAFGLRKTAAGTSIPYPAGLAVISGEGGDKLLVANNLSDNAVLLEVKSGQILQQFDLSTHEVVPSSFPYSVIAARDGRTAWCSLWNASRIAKLDLTTGQVTKWISLLESKSRILPGSHPTALLLSPDEKFMYVALSNADAVAVIETATGSVIHLASTRLSAQEFAGSYPNALAQSGDGKRLFVADASLNAIAVFDTATLARPGIEFPLPHEALGFIPTEWYPSALATAGDDLLIASAKGQGAAPNNNAGGTPYERRRRETPYIPMLLAGSIARLNFRNLEKDFPELTRNVEDTNLLNTPSSKIQFQGGSNPIRHVIYVIKENRTYDQILGDLRVGNGDPSLTMYGRDITPNEHKLALQFGVLDNFYDSGEVSGNGHDWSTAAITSDYNEKTWQIGYRSSEHTYDYQGIVGGELPLEIGEPDVDAPSTGYIWDNAASHGITYRDYGEYIGGIWCNPSRNKTAVNEDSDMPTAPCPRPVIKKGEPLPPNVGQPHGSASPWPWPVPVLKHTKPTKDALRDHFDPQFPDFNTEYPDQLRADEFLNEFEGFVSARQQQGQGRELPALVLLYLPNDHTHGTTPGKPRPAASVADNDLALGRVVEAISHSPYWDDTAIFVVEDDAQDGADHVDAHRSIALVISKYSPGSGDHPFVDGRFYTTVNMVHTMETLLGLPPMNQNDAYAPVMAPLFSGAGNQQPFSADWSNRENGLIYLTNPPKGQGAKASAKMDFTHPDAVNPAVLNAILWRDRKGSARMPAPKHSVFPQKQPRDDD